jgi:hypothetical protein
MPATIAATVKITSDATGTENVDVVLMKTHLRDRVQAVVMAYESGFVQPGEAGSAPASA